MSRAWPLDPAVPAMGHVSGGHWHPGQVEGCVKCPTELTTCQWFALCANPATDTQPHPVLGLVPVCARCKARAEL